MTSEVNFSTTFQNNYLLLNLQLNHKRNEMEDIRIQQLNSESNEVDT